MKETITVRGKILFDPPDISNKHKNQASWKKIAFVTFTGDICKYYSWFLLKRFNLPLARPLRRAHISFINDSERDLGENLDKWGELKRKWNGKHIDIVFNLEPKSDGINWWLTVDENSRELLHNIREEIGLGRPYWGLHMTLGYAIDSYNNNEETPNAKKVIMKNVEHSKYIHKILSNDNSGRNK